MKNLIGSWQSSYLKIQLCSRKLSPTLNKIKEKNANILDKIDLEKAFNKIEWSFIRNNLIFLFKFPNNSINLIISFNTISNRAILVNGDFTDFFESSVVLRQGELMFQYIFIQCIKMLSQKIEKKLT